MIGVFEHTGEGYLPLVDFQGWRVAILRHDERFAKLTGLERHLETDEVFVLLNGGAALIVEQENGIREWKMECGKVYNVPRNIWHHIVVTPDASVLVVENSNTSIENTEKKVVSC